MEKMALGFSTSVFIGTVVCVAISVLIYHLKRLRLYKAAATFPGPKTLPLIGNAHYFVGNIEDSSRVGLDLLDKYPSPFRVWLGSRLFFAVYDAEQVKTILLSPKAIEKDDLYKFAQPWVGTGLFIAPVAKWRINRKLITPTFNSRILESFVEVFAAQSVTLTGQMEKKLNGDEFDIFSYISLCTLDIICETAIGVPVNAQIGKCNDYVKAANRMLEIIYSRVLKIWLHPDVIFNFTSLAAEQRKLLNYLHGVTNNVIQKKKDAIKKWEVKQDNNDNTEKHEPRRKAFLDLLMELSHEGKTFTDEELREEVDTMMFAGSDTTAGTSSFVMLMLAMYPDLQEKAYQELLEIYGPTDPEERLLKNEDLQRMEYLERVIKETMRLFAIAPILVRYISKDLDIGPHQFPAGSSVVISIIKTHRSAEYWPDPLKFDPDRFLPSEVAKRHPYCYIPFSGGPRNCIGLKYAMMAMKTLLSTVLRKYVLIKDEKVPIKDIKLKVGIILKPVEPIRIRIQRRVGKA